MVRFAQAPHRPPLILPIAAIAIVLAVLLPLFAVPAVPVIARVPQEATAFLGPAPRLVTPSNLTLPLPNPHQNLRAGEGLTVSVAVEVANVSNPGGPFYIHLPTTVAEFPTPAGGLVTVSMAPHNFIVGPDGSVASATLSQTVAFVGGANLSQGPNATALFTSGGLAVLSSLPYGSLTANFRWIWSVLAPNGALLNSSQWGPWTPIVPAQTANVLSDGPNPVPVGTLFTVCLGGPTQNRVFSLHGQDMFGHEFGRASGKAPANNNSPFCLSLPIPSLPAGSLVYVHIWEYAAAALLLHLVQTPVTVQPLGSINGTVQPILATVVLDGVPLPPLLGGVLGIPASAGPHELLINESGYYPIAQAVNVPANGSAWFNVTLTPLAVGPARFGPVPLVKIAPVPAAIGATVVAVAIVLGALLWRSRGRPAKAPPSPEAKPAPPVGAHPPPAPAAAPKPAASSPAASATAPAKPPAPPPAN